METPLHASLPEGPKYPNTEYVGFLCEESLSSGSLACIEGAVTSYPEPGPFWYLRALQLLVSRALWNDRDPPGKW